MTIPFKALTLCACAAFSTACTDESLPGATTAPGYPTPPGYPTQPGVEGSERYFRQGHDRGVEDAAARKRPQPSTHLAPVPAGQREAFVRGYNDGYRGGGKVAESSQGGAYFERGRKAGRNDNRRGLNYDPSRHFRSLPANYRDEFTRGYAGGWQ